MRTGKQSILGNVTLFGNITGEDLKNLQLNTILNAFRIAIQGSLSVLQMVDSFVDEYEDQTGVDTGLSTGEFFNSTQSLYTTSTSGIDTNTKLLLHGNKIDTGISHPITFLGNAQIDDAQFQIGSTSLKLDGSGDYLSVPDSNDFYFGTGDFTIDFWVRFNTLPTSDNEFFLQRASGDSYFDCWTNASHTLFFSVVRSGVGKMGLQSNSAVFTAANTWYHVAVVRNGNNQYLFVDGVDRSGTIFTALSGTDLTDFTTDFSIGATIDGSNSIDGWLDEFRISKGIARWTSAFTPEIDSYESDIYTSLLLHFEGTDGATSTNDVSGGDNSGNNHPITYNVNAQTDTTQSEFGGSSILFDGSSYLTIPDSEDWNFGTGDFTIDMWVRWNDLTETYQRLYCQDELVAEPRSMGVQKAGDKLMFFWNEIPGGVASGKARTTSDLGLVINQWYHIAIVGNSGTILIFLDGIAQATTGDTFDGSFENVPAQLVIGASLTPSVGNEFNGWIDELRVSKGTARWTTDFTPPASEYTDEVINMVLISEIQTADEQPDNARIVIFEEDIDPITLNTDIKGWVSRDGGTTFTQITLVEESMYNAPARILSGSADISGQPSGTDMVYKITTDNLKALKLHGTGMLWS